MPRRTRPAAAGQKAKGVAGLLRAAWLRPKQTDLVPGKGLFRSRFHHPLRYCCPTTIFRDPRNRHRHHLSATLLAPKGLQVCFGRPGCALNRPIWSPVKGSSARVSTIRSGTVVRQRFFGIPATDTDIISAQHFWTGGLETAGPGCYDAVAIARAAGFRLLVMTPASASYGDCVNRR